MSKARVSWTTPASADLRKINEWLKQETSPRFALQTLAHIRFRAAFLQDFPRGARPLKDGTRVLRVLQTPYLIRYRLVDDEVEVLRVHHEREDWLLEP
jgi:toxin ParE1/3/4